MPVNRIGGFLISNVRRNCKFIFGDFFIRADTNMEERIFEIRLHKYLKVRQQDGSVKRESIDNYVDVKAFKRFWGAQWHLMFEVFEDSEPIKKQF